MTPPAIHPELVSGNGLRKRTCFKHAAYIIFSLSFLGTGSAFLNPIIRPTRIKKSVDMWGPSMSTPMNRYSNSQPSFLNALSALSNIWNDQYYVEDSKDEPKPITQKDVEIDLDRQVRVFEVTMTPPLGLQLSQTKGSGVIIDDVLAGSVAATAGLRAGDRVVATSATFGPDLWPKSTMEGVVSALNTRFFLGLPCTLRLERPLAAELQEYKYRNRVTETYEVALAKPLGVEIEQGDPQLGRRGVYVKAVLPGGNADRLGLLQPGDRLVAVSASLGDRMWECGTVEGAVSAVTSRKFDRPVRLRLERTVDLGEWRGAPAVPLRARPLSELWDEDWEGLFRQDRSVVKEALGQALRGWEALATAHGPEAEVDVLSPTARLEAQTVIAERALVLFRAFGKARSPQGVGYLLQRLRASRVAISPRLWNGAMAAAVAAGAPEQALEYFEALRAPSTREASERLADGGEAALAPPGGAAAGAAVAGAAGEGLLVPNEFVAATLVKALGALGRLEEANAVLVRCEAEWGVTPDAALCNAVLQANVRAGDLAMAEAVFRREMPRLGVQPNQRSYNVLIHGYVRAKRLEDAYALFDRMSQRGLRPDQVTLATLMKGRVRRGELTAATLLLIKMEDEYGLTPDVRSYNTLLLGLVRRLRWQEALQLERLMLQRGVAPDLVTYGHLIAGLIRARHPLRALWKYAEMRRRGLQPNAEIYTMVITAHAKRRSVRKAVAVLKEMKEANVKPTAVTFAAVMDACLRAGQAAVAVSLFEEVQRSGLPLDVVLYTLLVRAYGELGQVGRAFSALGAMAGAGVRPNLATYNALAEGAARWGHWARALEALDLLLAAGLTPSKATLEALARAPEGGGGGGAGGAPEPGAGAGAGEDVSREGGGAGAEGGPSRLDFLELAMVRIQEARNRPHSSILYLALLDECLQQHQYAKALEITKLNQVAGDVAVHRADAEDVAELEDLVCRLNGAPAYPRADPAAAAARATARRQPTTPRPGSGGRGAVGEEVGGEEEREAPAAAASSTKRQ